MARPKEPPETDLAAAPDTPMMRQYQAAKTRYPRHLLFFRLGDFYELFFEDAKVASRVLGLTLTSRSKGPDAVPMAGVPVHMAETYLARLLRQGFSVAVCDQTEDASQAKGLVKRDITRVVTPGTVVEENLLDARKPNRLVAVRADNGAPQRETRTFGLASVDLAEGFLHVQEVQGLAALSSELARLAPSEALLPEPTPLPPGARPVPLLPPGIQGQVAVSYAKPEAFGQREAHGRLQKRFEDSSLGKLLEQLPLGCSAAGALLGYLEEMHPAASTHLQPPSAFDPHAHLLLNETAIRSMELVETLRDRAYEGSLLWTLDRTCTGAGARMLREWVLRPLRELDALQARQASVAYLHAERDLRETLRGRLKETSDLERIAARLSAGRATPRDLIALKDSLRLLPVIAGDLDNAGQTVLCEIRGRCAGLDAVADRIEQTLRDDCPNALSDGGLIRDGVHEELDRLRSVASGGKQWIAEFQATEAARSGIPSLKVGYNRVFGYYIEVTRAHLERVPEDYERRQTLANAERFVTPALKEREAEVLGAEDKIRAIETQLFQTLREETARSARELQSAGSALAHLDALCSLAEVAARKGYIRPVLNEGRRLFFQQLRHPVLDETLSKGQVVPNDLTIAGSGKTNGDDAPQILLLTGPNMAGKSTYIRAAALAVILAQMGSFVPAEAAEVGLVDRIFTRVGAADDLFGGRSTFMVEMTEVAEILAHATDRSLVILDEVGRGTSTYDGVSLAWSIVEFLHDGPCRPKTLFATHYHELCGLEEELARVRNACAVVKEWQGEITFLYRIAAGSSERSFGLHAARLAGVPKQVIARARTILHELEEEARERVALVGSPEQPPQRKKRRRKPDREDGQLLLFEPNPIDIDPAVHAVLDELRGLDPDALTPMQALTTLADLVKRAKGVD